VPVVILYATTGQHRIDFLQFSAAAAEGRINQIPTTVIAYSHYFERYYYYTERAMAWAKIDM